MFIVLCLFVPRVGAVEFVDAFRAEDRIFLIAPMGQIYQLKAEGGLIYAFTLHGPDGRPLAWREGVASAVLFRGEWIVADGTSSVRHFDGTGRLIRTDALPIRVPKLGVSRGKLWALNLTAASAAQQLWFSVDGREFHPYAEGMTNERFASPLHDNIVVIGATPTSPNLFIMRLVGPPTLRQVLPRSRDITLAYSRSSVRATMEQVYGFVDDVSIYSLPARDVLPLDDGGVAVLRNREDVRPPSGKGLLLRKGMRIDRYDARGRHRATAELPVAARWIVKTTRNQVEAVTVSGELSVSNWGPAQAGEIITP